MSISRPTERMCCDLFSKVSIVSSHLFGALFKPATVLERCAVMNSTQSLGNYAEHDRLPGHHLQPRL